MRTNRSRTTASSGHAQRRPGSWTGRSIGSACRGSIAHVFGAILDATRAGGSGSPRRGRRAAPQAVLLAGHNVLVTRFLHPDGVAEVEDYMPVGPGRAGRPTRPPGAGAAAGCRWRWSAPGVRLRPGEARTEVSGHGARFDGPGLSLGWPRRPAPADGGGAVAAFDLGEGQSATFVLRPSRRTPTPAVPGTEEAGAVPRDGRLLAAVGGRCTYRGGGVRSSCARPWR